MTSETFPQYRMPTAWKRLKSPSLRYVGDCLFHATVYALLGGLGMRVAFVSSNASPIWFAAGYALALLVIRGPAMWPSIALATVLITRLSGLPWLACGVIAIGNSLEALLAYYLIRPRRNFAQGINTISDVVTLVIFGCILVTPITGAIGAFALWSSGILADSQVLNAWFIWSVGDGMGILIATPLIVGFARGAFHADLIRLGRRSKEALFLFALLLGALAAAAADPHRFAFLFFPIVFWTAIRIGQLGVLASILTIVVSSSVATLLGHGPMAGATMVIDLAFFELYLGFLAVGGLLTAAASRSDLLRAIEHTARIAAEDQAAALRKAQESVALGEHRLMLALRTAQMSAWEWTNGSRLTFSDDAECRTLQCVAVRDAIESAIEQIPTTTELQSQELPVQIDNKRQWIEVKWRDIGGGGKRHLIGVCTDVTEVRKKRDARDAELKDTLLRSKKLVEVAEDARRARTIAEGATEAKSAFVAALSHEVRNPLAVIRGFTDLMMMSDGSAEERQSWLRAIDRNCHLMENLVNDVLDLSKVEAGRLDVEVSPIDLDDDFDEVLNLVGLEAARKNIQLQLTVAPKVPRQIVTDPTRFRQILLNLLGNAIKFTEKGLVAIEVSSVAFPSGKNQLKISVTDSGIGIDPKLHARIFEPFRQATPAIHQRFGGTGLGLSLARKLAEALGGTLVLEWSEPEKGSCFTLTLPMVSSVAKPAADLVTMAQPAPLPSLVNMRLLIVDDSPDNQFLCQKVLESAGACADTANDGMEAVRKAELGHYDVILMDIQMPIMDGYAAMQALRKRNIESPVIALTAHVLSTERQRAIEVGFKGYLTKPIERDRLIKVVHEIKSSGRESLDFFDD